MAKREPSPLPLPLFDPGPRQPVPQRPGLEKPYRTAEGTVWTKCPLCRAHERYALVLSGHHLVYRAHDLETWGGAHVPCPASGVAVCELIPKAWLTTDPVRCPHDAR